MLKTRTQSTLPRNALTFLGSLYSQTPVRSSPVPLVLAMPPMIFITRSHHGSPLVLIPHPCHLSSCQQTLKSRST